MFSINIFSHRDRQSFVFHLHKPFVGISDSIFKLQYKKFTLKEQTFHIYFEDIVVVPDFGPVSSPRVVANITMRKHFWVHFRLVLHLLKHVTSLDIIFNKNAFQ